MSDLSYRVELTAPDIEPYRAGNTGIDYVTSFTAAEAGPHVLVTALTHGNEICGAIALDKLFGAGIRPRRRGRDRRDVALPHRARRRRAR